MTTRCLIGNVNQDSSVTTVYCHADGYPEGVGKTLTENYIDADLVEELLDLGDLSYLGRTIESQHTCAYMRDRGENRKGPVRRKSTHDALRYAEKSGLQYVYLFSGDGWKIFEI